MAWTYNNIRIFVQKFDGATGNVIARLQPISGETIRQIFGYESEIIKVACIVVGETDFQAIRTLAQNGSYNTLTDGGSFSGSYVIHGFAWSKLLSIAQTLRPDLDCASPLYSLEIEFYEYN